MNRRPGPALPATNEGLLPVFHGTRARPIRADQHVAQALARSNLAGRRDQRPDLRRVEGTHRRLPDVPPGGLRRNVRAMNNTAISTPLALPPITAPRSPPTSPPRAAPADSATPTSPPSPRSCHAATARGHGGCRPCTRPLKRASPTSRVRYRWPTPGAGRIPCRPRGRSRPDDHRSGQPRPARGRPVPGVRRLAGRITLPSARLGSASMSHGKVVLELRARKSAARPTASVTASVRLAAPSLVRMLEMCTLTVFVDDEGRGDLLVGAPLLDEGEHLCLASRQHACGFGATNAQHPAASSGRLATTAQRLGPEPHSQSMRLRQRVVTLIAVAVSQGTLRLPHPSLGAVQGRSRAAQLSAIELLLLHRLARRRASDARRFRLRKAGTHAASPLQAQDRGPVCA